jgi:hypothetical protein
MRNYQGDYGCDMAGFVKRERFSISMHPDLLAQIDGLSASLGASRPDVLEIITAFYFAYLRTVDRRPPPQVSASALVGSRVPK